MPNSSETYARVYRAVKRALPNAAPEHVSLCAAVATRDGLFNQDPSTGEITFLAGAEDIDPRLGAPYEADASASPTDRMRACIAQEKRVAAILAANEAERLAAVTATPAPPRDESGRYTMSPELAARYEATGDTPGRAAAARETAEKARRRDEMHVRVGNDKRSEAERIADAMTEEKRLREMGFL